MTIAPSLLRTATTRYFSRPRLLDILVLQGTPLFGAVFALTPFRASDVVSIVTLVAGNLFLMTHVFMLNDWAGLQGDLADPNKAPRVFTARGVATRDLAVTSTALLAASLFLFSLLGWKTVAIALGIAALSAVYSLPPVHFRGRALLNSATHLCGGALHFLLGYSIGQTVDARGVAIGAYFALIFAAGHLAQEVRDYSGDSTNGIGTNAVTFGPRRTFIASVLLFAAAHAVFLLLAFERMIPRVLAAVVVLFPLQLYWSFNTLRDRLTYDGVSRLQSRYRLLYAVIGICIVAALVL